MRWRILGKRSVNKDKIGRTVWGWQHEIAVNKVGIIDPGNRKRRRCLAISTPISRSTLREQLPTYNR